MVIVLILESKSAKESGCPGSEVAARQTIMVHFGLWLAVLGVRNEWRFLIALFLIPSGLGAYLLLWHRGLITALPVLAGLGWLLFKIIRGEKLDP
jgi:hypothetical protein